MIIVYKEHFSSAYFISHIHVKGETVQASDKAGEKRPAWQGQGQGQGRAQPPTGYKTLQARLTT